MVTCLKVPTPGTFMGVPSSAVKLTVNDTVLEVPFEK